MLMPDGDNFEFIARFNWNHSSFGRGECFFLNYPSYFSILNWKYFIYSKATVIHGSPFIIDFKICWRINKNEKKSWIVTIMLKRKKSCTTLLLSVKHNDVRIVHGTERAVRSSCGVADKGGKERDRIFSMLVLRVRSISFLCFLTF